MNADVIPLKQSHLFQQDNEMKHSNDDIMDMMEIIRQQTNDGKVDKLTDHHLLQILTAINQLADNLREVQKKLG